MSDQRVSDASGNAKRIAGSFTASTITILTETRCKTPWINNPVTGRASAVAGGAGVADLAGVAELAGHTADHSAVHGAVGPPLPAPGLDTDPTHIEEWQVRSVRPGRYLRDRRRTSWNCSSPTA